MSDIIIKDENALYKLKDAVLAQTDEVNAALARFDERGAAISADQKAMKDELTRTQAALESANARMDAMDKALPKGGKGYIANESAETAGKRARQKVGEMVVDLARAARGLPEKFGALSEMRTQKEGNVSGGGGSADAGGGLLVPEETSNEIIKLVADYGLARKLCRIMPMTRDVMRLPLSTYMPTTLVGSNITPSASGAYYQESRAGSQVTQNFTRPELVAVRCMAIDNVSIEVDEDSDPSLMNFLVDVFAEAVALAEDWQVLRSDNAPFDGIIPITGASGIYNMPSGSASFKNISYKDLIQVYNTVDEKVQETGAWVMSNYAWNQIQTAMVDANGRPFNLADTQSAVAATGQRFIFGRPVYLSTMMPKGPNDAANTKFLIYGDFKYAIFGDRRKLAIDVSPHAGFTTGDLVMRVLERFAFKAVFAATAAAAGSFAVCTTKQ